MLEFTAVRWVKRTDRDSNHRVPAVPQVCCHYTTCPLPEEYSHSDTDPSPALLVEAPCADDSGGRRTLQFSTRETSERVVADAEFVVHADAHWDTDEFDLRVLRVRLERPSGGGGASADSKSLWLSIDISERYKHRRPPNRTAFPSQVLPVHEEQPISNSECTATNRSNEQAASNASHEAALEKKPVRCGFPHVFPHIRDLHTLCTAFIAIRGPPGDVLACAHL